MRKFKHTTDVYATVHAECLSQYNLRKLSPSTINMLKTLYTRHNVMKDSPFITST